MSHFQTSKLQSSSQNSDRPQHSSGTQRIAQRPLTRQKTQFATWRGDRMKLMGLLMGLWLIGCSAEDPATTPVVPEPSVPGAISETSAEDLADSPSSENSGQMLPISAQIMLEDITLELEVVQTPQQQAIGLMFREDLPDNRGMLFPFSQARTARFWMRNVPIDLDMVFLRSGEVIWIEANVPPCTTAACPTYGPDALVDQVLELRGGRATELGIDVGDRLEVIFLE